MSKLLSGDDDQADTELTEFLQQGGAAEHAARKSVQSMDHNLVHLAGPDESYQPLKCWALGGCAGITFVIKPFWEQKPAQ